MELLLRIGGDFRHHGFVHFDAKPRTLRQRSVALGVHLPILAATPGGIICPSKYPSCIKKSVVAAEAWTLADNPNSEQVLCGASGTWYASHNAAIFRI